METAGKIPVTYVAGFITDPSEVFRMLWNDLDWERRGGTPRREYYSNDALSDYTYGSGAGVRTYAARPWHPLMLDIRARVEAVTGTAFEACFINGYENSRDHLGWHSDSSPEMDSNRPIAIVSVGAAREIWYCPKEDRTDITRMLLEPGSLCIMAAGMQKTHLHRIPKADREVGPRISLTFRGLAG